MLICGILGISALGYGQIVTVIDAESGEPLEAATISSKDTQAFTTTNARGRADLSEFWGAQLIELRMVGYETKQLSYQELEVQNFVVRMKRAFTALDQVVVSATRWRQTQRGVPARIATITPGEVSLQNPQTAADLLGASGQVFIQKSQQGGGSPMIRGFSTNRLLYAVDGVRMNTAIFRSGNLQNVISLDPFAMESTEVLFGPGSVIYGSDAIGGVMSFQTLHPRLSLTGQPLLSGKAVLRYASANQERTAHFDVQVGWKKWALLTSFSTFQFGDLRMGRFGPEEYRRPFYLQRIDSTDAVTANPDPLVQTPTGYGQINLMQKVRFQPGDHWNFEYGFHYSTTTDYPRYDWLIRLRDGAPRSAEWNYGPQVWMLNNLSATHSNTNAAYDQMRIRLAHQRFEESRIDRDFNDPQRRTRLEQVSAFSANLDFTKAGHSRSQFYYGLEAVINDVRSSGSYEDIRTGARSSGPSRYPQANWSSYAGYLTWEYRFSQRWLLQAGARYNHFLLNADFRGNIDFFPIPTAETSIHQGALTGSLGGVFSPGRGWQLKLNLSTGFRAPNVDDIGKVFDSEPGAVVVPNPGLQAEYAYNAELSAAKVFGESVRLDFTAYYTWLNNALVRRDFRLNGQDSILYDGELSRVQAVQNAAVARVYGLQAGIELELFGGFGFSSRINAQVGEEELDDGRTSPSRHAAPPFGVTRLTFTTDKLELEANAFYSGGIPFDELPVGEQAKDHLYARDENGNPYSPAWYTLNLRALYQLTEVLALSAGVKNLTDQRYRTYSSGIAAAGRNVVIAVRAEF
jgi:hemoglobin/transferrin/lactoferrin receptor protein